MLTGGLGQEAVILQIWKEMWTKKEAGRAFQDLCLLMTWPKSAFLALAVKPSELSQCVCVKKDRT